MPQLTGPQYKQVVEAILDGFDRDSLAQLLLYDLNAQLSHIAADGPFRQVAHEVVQWVQARGLIPDLLNALEKARPGNTVVTGAVQSLRAALALPAPANAAAAQPAAAPPPPPPSRLEDFPREKLVPPDRIPLSFIPVFSQLYPTSDKIFQIVVAANQLRRSVDPSDQVIDINDINNPAAVGANAVWTNILLQTCRLGPRMVAALVLSAPSVAFGEDRDRFLRYLAKMN